MYQKPRDGEQHTRTVKDKLFHWCEGNGAHKPKWVRHDPKTCRGNKNTEEKVSTGPATGSTPGGNSSGNKVSWSAGMMATINDVDE